MLHLVAHHMQLQPALNHVFDKEDIYADEEGEWS
jgi:hypothetical protein